MSLCSAPEVTCARAYAVPTSKLIRDPTGMETNTGIASSETVSSAGAWIRYWVHCGARRYSASKIDCAAAVEARASARERGDRRSPEPTRYWDHCGFGPFMTTLHARPGLPGLVGVGRGGRGILLRRAVLAALSGRGGRIGGRRVEVVRRLARRIGDVASASARIATRLRPSAEADLERVSRLAGAGDEDRVAICAAAPRRIRGRCESRRDRIGSRRRTDRRLRPSAHDCRRGTPRASASDAARSHCARRR